jgi:hypothetical protein
LKRDVDTANESYFWLVSQGTKEILKELKDSMISQTLLA